MTQMQEPKGISARRGCLPLESWPWNRVSAVDQLLFGGFRADCLLEKVLGTNLRDTPVAPRPPLWCRAHVGWYTLLQLPRNSTFQIRCRKWKQWTLFIRSSRFPRTHSPRICRKLAGTSCDGCWFPFPISPTWSRVDDWCPLAVTSPLQASQEPGRECDLQHGGRCTKPITVFARVSTLAFIRTVSGPNGGS